jgi:hypothetical protein
MSESVASVEKAYKAKLSGLSAQNQTAAAAATVVTAIIIIAIVRFITCEAVSIYVDGRISWVSDIGLEKGKLASMELSTHGWTLIA